jgi:hypothetical protein
MLAALIPVLGPILARAAEGFIPDPKARDKWVSETLGMFMQADTSQIEVNREEAKSSSLFIAGWRPFIGWTCGVALAYTYILVPLVMYVGFVIGKPLPNPPALDGSLWELMFGLLGMSALRTFEKFKNVSGK